MDSRGYKYVREDKILVSTASGSKYGSSTVPFISYISHNYMSGVHIHNYIHPCSGIIIKSSMLDANFIGACKHKSIIATYFHFAVVLVLVPPHIRSVACRVAV